MEQEIFDLKKQIEDLEEEKKVLEEKLDDIRGAMSNIYSISRNY